MLKENIDMLAFLDAVEQCRGAVSFVSTEGDILNIKSELSRFVLVACANKSIIKEGKVVCKDEGDYERLAEYITDTGN